MHAPAALYRLRDRLALTRPELTALLTIASLFAAGLVVKHLPAPPTALDPGVIQYHEQFVAAAEAPEPEVAAVADSVQVEAKREQAAARSRKVKATAERPVGINTATAAQLETLPRVGPKMAERIIAYRDERGGFQRVNELRNVRGIGEKTFEQLRPLVTLD